MTRKNVTDNIIDYFDRKKGPSRLRTHLIYLYLNPFELFEDVCMSLNVLATLLLRDNPRGMVQDWVGIPELM